MKITIIAVGKIKEKYLVEGIKEYSKRLSKYTKLEIIEVADEQAPENLSKKDMDIVKDKEAKKIESKIKDSYVIALVIKGVMFTSEEFANKIEDIKTYNASHITFIIGGSLGLSNSVLRKVNLKMSFSEMTFPHQLMRLILLEQMLHDIKGKKDKVQRSTIERVQSFNHSESFMNVQIVKNLTPSQKQVVFLLLNSKNPLNYQVIADQVGSSIVTVRRHINDIKRAGVEVKEKISVKNRSKVFYLDEELKGILNPKKSKVKVDSEGNKGENNSERGIEVVPVRDYIG